MKKPVFIVTLIILINCSNQDATYTVEIIDDVKHIHNIAPMWGEEPKVKLDYIRKYSDPSETNPTYQFFRPMDIDVDREGNIYVLDSGNFRIQKYDSNGKYMKTIGRRGQGPGEFESADKFCLDKQENIFVTDWMRAIVFDSNGEEINRFHKEGRRLDDLTVLSTGEYAIVMYADEKDEALIGIFDDNLNYVRAIGEKLNRDKITMREYGWLENVVDFVLDDNDRFFLTHRCVNRVAMFEPGGSTVWITDRPLKFKIETIEESGVKAPPQVSLGIGVDHKKRVWVLTINRLVKEDEFTAAIDDPDLCDYHIFDKDGIFLGSIPSDNRMFFYPGNKMEIFGDRLFLIDGDEMSISEYKIIDLED
jgi:hypothetical protein